MPEIDKSKPVGQNFTGRRRRRIGRCKQDSNTDIEELLNQHKRGFGRKKRLRSGWNVPGDGCNSVHIKGKRRIARV